MNECDLDVCGPNKVSCTDSIGGYTCECHDENFFHSDSYGSGCTGLATLFKSQKICKCFGQRKEPKQMLQAEGYC